ncbi:toxin co-regulated pilus biosynthesis Q family protein [Burkholderia territorii]|uniref:toxin co-regulated pilus biosynthesis Q family protein n=1 Tax=Burkholderia territorii TaxID=1503055 RepID=UPI0009BE3FA7|nr:toxin co-regulated pilus biosynthesis Q family protein [Burkholderia territorii]
MNATVIAPVAAAAAERGSLPGQVVLAAAAPSLPTPTQPSVRAPLSGLASSTLIAPKLPGEPVPPARQQIATARGDATTTRSAISAASPSASAAASADTNETVIAAAGESLTNDSATVSPRPAAPVETFTLIAGESMQAQLLRWAKRVKWSISWNIDDDWIVPGDTSYTTDFPTAVEKVIKQAAANGADVRADIWSGNQTVVVHASGATE